MGNPVKQDRTLAPLSSSTQLALTHAPSGYTRLDTDPERPLHRRGPVRNMRIPATKEGPGP